MEISFGTACAYSLLGFAIVFVGLIFLMIVIKVMSVIMSASQKRKAASAPEVKAAEEPAPAPAAPGSAGDIKIFDVPDREAAMIMAITADKLKKPLNELHFKSIKEVK